MSHSYWTNKQTVESPLFDNAGGIALTFAGEVSTGPIRRALESNPLSVDWIVVNHGSTAILSLNDFGLITITRVSGLSNPETLDKDDADSDQIPTVLNITVPGKTPQIATLRGRLMVKRRPDGTLAFGEVMVTKETRKVLATWASPAHV